MGHGKFLAETSDVSTVQGYRFQTKSIRLFPVDIRKQEGKHKEDVESESSLLFMIGSTNLNEKVVATHSVPLGSSGRLIQRRNYTFLGGCSLKSRSLKRLSSLNVPSAPHPTSVQSNNPSAKITSCNVSSENDEHSDCIDSPDFDSQDLLVGIAFSSGVESDAGTRMYCHFDNNPEDRMDRSVMIALKFNPSAVIQAHGHLDGCSQFVKVDLGIGDRTGGNASAAARQNRFSCVLTSTFPCKPTHPNQCVVSGRLCSISELENAMLDYYSSSPSTCQRGIAGKSDKESGKLKFLQGHIFVSICSGDYDLDGMARRQNARLLAAADGISVFERRMLAVERSEGATEESVAFMMSSSSGKKFSCDLAPIKLKSTALAEMMEMHGEPADFGGRNVRVFSMRELTSEAVTALISYFGDFPFKECGITMISCQTAVSLIEIARKYRIYNLEQSVIQLIIEEKEHLWFDIKSLVKMFQLYSTGSHVDGEKVKFKILQAFRMKRHEDDAEGCVERFFMEDPNTAAEMLMEALTICSKHRPEI